MTFCIPFFFRFFFPGFLSIQKKKKKTRLRDPCSVYNFSSHIPQHFFFFFFPLKYLSSHLPFFFFSFSCSCSRIKNSKAFSQLVSTRYSIFKKINYLDEICFDMFVFIKTKKKERERRFLFRFSFTVKATRREKDENQSIKKKRKEREKERDK